MLGSWWIWRGSWRPGAVEMKCTGTDGVIKAPRRECCGPGSHCGVNRPNWLLSPGCRTASINTEVLLAEWGRLLLTVWSWRGKILILIELNVWDAATAAHKTNTHSVWTSFIIVWFIIWMHTMAAARQLRCSAVSHRLEVRQLTLMIALSLI